MGKQDVVLWRAERLAVGLRSAQSPSVCPNCLAYFVYGRYSEEGSTSLVPNLVLLSYRCHSFWNALASFLLRDWSPEKRAGLHERLKRNRERCTLCPPDTLWGTCACDYLRHVFDSCCKALYLCLFKDPSRKDQLHWDIWTRWPDDKEELFPSGRRAAVAFLIQSLGKIDYAHHLLSVLLGYNRRQLMPIISEDANKDAILSRVLSFMQAATANLEKKKAAQSVTAGDQGPCDMTPMGTVPLLLLTVCFAEDNAPLDVAYLGEYHLALSNALNALIQAGDDSGMDTGIYLRLAAVLWNKLPAHLKGPRPPFVHPTEEKSHIIMSDPYRHLRNALRLVERPICWNNGCPTRRDRSVRPWDLRKCAGCHFTRYCSRECQKADWRGDGEPHRELCGMLQELFRFASPEMYDEEFSDACRDNAFPLARVDRLIAWASGDSTRYAADVEDGGIISQGSST